MTDTFWNGTPTNAVCGLAVVADSPQFPKYWARAKDLIGETIEVVQVDWQNYGGGCIYLDNSDGRGWSKVTFEKGASHYPHRTVQVEPDTFKEHPHP